MTARYPRIDVLINNAGLIATGTRTITGDGQKMTFQVNHLPPFLLTTLLHEPLTHSQARVITTASSASISRQASVVLDLEAQRSCRALGAYATSKLENVLFARELARRWGPAGVGDVVPHRRERPLGEFPPGAQQPAPVRPRGSLFRPQRPWTSRATRRRTVVTASLATLTRWK